MTIKGMKKRINTILWKSRRWVIRKYYHLSLGGENSHISIISCNCIGGVVMSELGMSFMTPTVNLFFSSPDFVKFCENLEYYLSVIPKNGGKALEGYPLVILDDIIINAVHYNDFNHFLNTWNKRKKRVNFKRLFLIFTDRDGFTSDLLPRIAVLPYKKVLFSNRKYENYDFVCTVPGFEDEACVGSLVEYIGISGKRIYSIYPFAKIFKRMIADNGGSL